MQLVSFSGFYRLIWMSDRESSSDSTGTCILYNIIGHQRQLSRKVDQVQSQLHEVKSKLQTIEEKLQLLVDFHDRAPVQGTQVQTNAPAQ